MKKLFISASCAVLCSGFAFSIYQAANDYGMKENKLHSAIVAQSDETSGGGSGGETSGGSNFQSNSYMKTRRTQYQSTSNSNGMLIVEGMIVSGYKSNTTYTITVLDRYCEYSPNEHNKCDKSKESTVVSGIAEGYGTNGDGTNG